jgi:hypothetical protein
MGVGPETPNVRARYPSPSGPFLADVPSKAGARVSLYNPHDYALVSGPPYELGPWCTNNMLRPVGHLGYSYTGPPDVYVPEDIYNPEAAISHFWKFSTELTFPEDTHKIFSYCAEARQLPLGAIGGVTGFNASVNLETSYGFDHQHYSHSKQFRSNITAEWPYWDRVKNEASLSHN